MHDNRPITGLFQQAVAVVDASLDKTTLDAEASLLEILQRAGHQRIYIHDYAALNVPTLCDAKAGALSRRTERALVMAQRGDVVLLDDPVDPDYLDYLQELDLGPRRESIVVARPSEALSTLADPALADRMAERLIDHVDPSKQTCISTYYPTRGVERLVHSVRSRLGRPVVLESGSPMSMELANRKDRMRSEVERLGIPVAPGEIADAQCSPTGRITDAVVQAVERQLPTTGGVFLRGAWSSCGVDVVALTPPLDVAALEAWLGRRGHMDTYLVEALLPLFASPNIQLWVDADGRAEVFCISEQRLSADGRHLGNAYPYQSALLPPMRAAALSIARMLGTQGFRGPLGIDMMEVPGAEQSDPTFAFAEANGRINASTYALALFENINARRRELGRAAIGAWVSRGDAPVSARRFDDLRRRLGNLIYRPGADSGVVPYNTGLLSDGVVDLLCLADSVSEALEVEREALDRMHG